MIKVVPSRLILLFSIITSVELISLGQSKSPVSSKIESHNAAIKYSTFSAQKQHLFNASQRQKFEAALKKKVLSNGDLVAYIETANGSDNFTVQQIGFMSPSSQINLETQSVLGSVTKWLTAVFISSLDLDLNQTLGRYLNLDELRSLFDNPIRASKVTLQQLLSHRSGLQENPQPQRTNGEWGRPGLSRMTLSERFAHEADLIARGKAAKFKFTGESGKFSYSNLGFGLIGLIVERAFPEKSFNTIRHEFFSNLKMKRTDILPTDENHFLTIDPKDFEDDPIFQPAGALYSCVQDLTVFIKTLREIAQGKKTIGLLNADKLNEISTPIDFSNPYAIGVRHEGDFLAHRGERGHFIAVLKADVFGDSGEIIIGLSNEHPEGNPDMVSIVPILETWRDML